MIDPVTKSVRISGSTIQFHFGGNFSDLRKLLPEGELFIITDENVYAAHRQKFSPYRTIVVSAGEVHKQQSTIDAILRDLVALKADRSAILVGVGGGVITDMAGYAASVYLRGVRAAFVPTTVLAMVDAAIGGKNGVDLGVYKNLVGSFRQPELLLYDFSLLETLPDPEWSNGFAEIIKHAAIRSKAMFGILEKNSLSFFRENPEALQQLIVENAWLKVRIVKADPKENGQRRLLNFGHTLGHAIENDLGIMHGQAVAIGMVYAAELSRLITGFEDTARLMDAIEQYELPTHAAFDMQLALNRMMADKKRYGKEMRFVLLDALGKGRVEAIPVEDLRKHFLQMTELS